MPNGELENHYGAKVLAAGKNPDKARFSFIDVPNFELLEVPKSRVKVIYFNKAMNKSFKDSLDFYEGIFNSQGD